jgi:hypothetical protein
MVLPKCTSLSMRKKALLCDPVSNEKMVISERRMSFMSSVYGLTKWQNAKMTD